MSYVCAIIIVISFTYIPNGLFVFSLNKQKTTLDYNTALYLFVMKMKLRFTVGRVSKHK